MWRHLVLGALLVMPLLGCRESPEALSARLRRECAAIVDEAFKSGPEVERLEAAIARLTDAIEAGQPVGDRLKQRQTELDTLRAKLAEPVDVDLNRAEFEVQLARLIEPLRWTGPVVNERDPLQTRQAMRHLGVEAIVVQPEPDGSWSFKGTGDLSRLSGCIMGPSRLPPIPPTGHPLRPR